MMELKVWVDGIQRVVCGVTMETTCQDVVIALAHAMGRTGRFTLIEKWRDVERPLTPDDYPLKVLHKWGEYAVEVKLYLCESNVDRHKQRDRHKQPNKFTHNFSPPKSQSDSSIKRNLTFSGARDTSSSHLGHLAHLHRPGLDNGLSPRSSSHSSSSSVRSSPRPVPAPRQNSPANLTRVPPGHSPLLNGQIPSALPNKTNIVRPIPSRTHLLPGGIDASRGRSPSPNTQRYNSPSRQMHDSSSQRQNSPSNLKRHSPMTDLTLVTPVEHSLESPLHERRPSSELEEYDLDMNFPDILRDSKQNNRQLAHTEYKLEESTDTQPEPERTRLLRLVAQQTERLKVQESQLDVIETEIISLEEKEAEYEHDLQRLTDDLLQLEQREHEDETELSELSSTEWVHVLEVEQTKGKQLKNTVSDLHVKISDLENQLSVQRTKVPGLESDIAKARTERDSKEKEAERQKKEKEAEVLTEQKKIQVELNQAKALEDREKNELDEIDSKLSEVEKSLVLKQETYKSLEEDLKKVNLEDFGSKSLSPTLGKSADSGEAVLKILEGRLSPRPNPTTPTQQAFINSLASKNPNGVWV